MTKSMASKCTKFLPNIFNKAKCQHCFAAKEAHSAQALENNKASRKVSKCGYLFVSPGYDFSNPVDRTRRWQRRFFRLYDDGELSYCVDENPDTVPQGVVDMNKCTDVHEAEVSTSHQFSLAVITPDKTLHIKGNSKEEIQWWQEILAEFPKALKAVKPRRKQPYLILSNKENATDATDGPTGGGEPKQGHFDIKSHIDGPAYATFRGVRSLKHRYDTSHQEGMRKSSSLHDLSSDDKEMRNQLESSRFLSRSGDRLDILSRDVTFSLSRNQAPSLSNHPPFTVPRNTWTRTGQSIPATYLTSKNTASSHSSLSSMSSSGSTPAPRRGSLDDRLPANTSKNGNGKLHRERSSSLKDFPTQFSVPRDNGDDLNHPNMSADETDSNATDEFKMARSSELNASSRVFSLVPTTSVVNTKSASNKYEDLVYMKKGWLIKQGSSDKESRKHWFVLAGDSLRYYKDAKAEESNVLDGRIDLSSCYEVSETATHRNYGFKIKTGNGEYTLAAMTQGIRSNWMKAIRLCMELQSSIPKWKFEKSSTASPASTKSPPRTAVDDLKLMTGVASSSSTVLTGASGETTFHVVGRRDPHKRESQKPARRHHSDVNPGIVSNILSVKEFTASLEPSIDSLASSGSSTRSSDSQQNSVASGANTERSDLTPRASKKPRHHSPSSGNITWSARPASRDPTLRIKRYVEGSDNLPASTSSGAAAQGPEQAKQIPKRSITSESTKEEVKREMMRKVKSPSARVMEKSRGGKTLRLHSPITVVEDSFSYHVGSATASESDTADDPTYTDMPLSEDDYPAHEDTDHDEVGSATASDVVGDDALVEILETEVESLKDRLEHTQTELDKMHKDNMDLKSRLHKETAQSLDSGYGSRWGQISSSSDASSNRYPSSSQTEALKRQLKESRDTAQRQRMDIENLKSKLDMSVSKLTGTEKALSEALKDYKQEKDKFLKLSSEWNRRIRTMETQSKDNIHKLEHSRESLQAKERECRRLEAEMKGNLQRIREQEREILKLKAVEHEYNQLKEKLDDKEHEIVNLRSELKEKEHLNKKIKDDYERQLEELDREYVRERDDIENHMEQLKSELYSAHDRQASMTDNMTSNMADMLKEKDDIIAQLEEKMIEADKKLEDLAEELHTEMGENADLAHTFQVLQNDKLKLASTIDELESQLMSMKSKVSTFETENFTLKRQLEELHLDNKHLHESLSNVKLGRENGAQGEEDREKLKKTILYLNNRIQELQVQMELVKPVTERSSGSLSSISSIGSDHHQDLLHCILVVDSQLKEVNAMLHTLRQNFDTYMNSLADSQQGQVITLADLIEDIGHKCQDIQDTLHESNESVQSPRESDYKHTINVTSGSSNKVIMEEYKGLKVKLDQALADLRKARKDLKDTCASYDSLKREDSKLKEKVAVMEGAYKQQIVELIARIDGLTDKIVNIQSGAKKETRTTAPFSDNASDVMKDIDHQLGELGSRILLLEQQARSIGQSKSSRVSEAGASPLKAKLEDIKRQLEDTNSKMKHVCQSFPSSSSSSSLSPISSSTLQSKLESHKERVGALVASSFQLSAAPPTSANAGINPSAQEDIAAAASVSNCLHEIREKVREIGEQLDSLEEDDEDSDSEEEDGEEQTTVEDIRDKLASLTEYIEQHSKLSTSDWMLLRLLTLQKEHLKATKEIKEPMEPESMPEDKLKLYADRLSLEAVLLSEMAIILQNKDCLKPENTVCREIDSLSNQVLLLHKRIDNEIRTMHFEDPQADLLSSYVEVMAEKILVNSQLNTTSFDQRYHLGKEMVNEAAPSLQPVLLATEALMRSQIDSFVSSNMDKTADEIISLPTHLTSRAIVQGELTCALSLLKNKLGQSPELLKAGPANYHFMFNRLLEREKKVLATIDSYEKQLVHSLAVIIFKESEEMTIVEGPESVLEAMCSELSTIMEKHIQVFKEKCRSTLDTHSARKYDIIVNEFRSIRESVLSEIKAQHEAYAKDPTSIRDSSLDIPVQSLDDTINNFGEILSLKAVVVATTNFLSELLKMGDAVLSDLELDQDSSNEEGVSIEKGLTSFVNALSEALERESLSKEALSRQIICDNEAGNKQASGNVDHIVLRMPNLSHYPDHLPGRAQALVREAVFSAQLTFALFKQKLLHDREIHRLKGRWPRHELNTEVSRDSDDTLDLQADYQALLLPLEEVLESKHVDELETLRVVLGLVTQMTASWSKGEAMGSAGIEDQLRQLEQKLQHELEVVQQRHETQLEVFKQECGKLEKTLEEQQQERDHYEERCAQLEDELTTLQLQHEEEKDRVKQDILTAVHAIRSNDEKSEMHLIEKVSRLGKDLAMQKLNFKKILGSLKKELAGKDKSSITQTIEDHMKSISLSPEEEEEEYHPPLPSQPPPVSPNSRGQVLEASSAEVKEPAQLHLHEVELLKKEKEEALAEEMRNTKAALDAVRTAYEDELSKEKAKYKEALMTMYTEEYVNEIRLRHQEDEDRMTEELQKLSMHYSSKCEDYKLIEMKLQQTKQDYESHINQLIASNDHLEEMLNSEIDSLKEFIKNKPSIANLTTGSATMEEELYDAKIMVRVKDAELQKLRSQVKVLENSLHRTTEEQRQTMTQYMQCLKTSTEMKKQYQEEIAQLTEKLSRVLGSQGLKANIRRTPSFHQRARSPSPQSSTSPRKELDHSSRDSHRRRHIHPKDLRRSKSSPSLPYVFDGKGSLSKPPVAKPGRRSRSPKS